MVVCKKTYVLSKKKMIYLYLFIGAKARRLRMDNQNGTCVPTLTPAAEHLSTLSTLKEVREKWVYNNNAVATPTFGGLFGLGLKRPKPKRTRTPVM
jgi:hypothetical protein